MLNNTKQIRIHGRGGQGVVTAAEIIAIAAFHSGNYSQAFPMFGVERTGAPIESYVRISNHPIRTREQIYEPDILVVQDASLLDAIDITKGCDQNTIIIINTSKNKSELNIKLPAKNIYTIDATQIALEILKKNIVNTVIIGAMAKATGLIDLNGLKKAINEKFQDKGKDIINKNIKAVSESYKLS